MKFYFKELTKFLDLGLYTYKIWINSNRNGESMHKSIKSHQINGERLKKMPPKIKYSVINLYNKVLIHK